MSWTWSFRDDGTAEIELGIGAGVGTYSVQDGLPVIVLEGAALSFEVQTEPDRLTIDADGTALAFGRARPDDEAPRPAPERP